MGILVNYMFVILLMLEKLYGVWVRKFLWVLFAMFYGIRFEGLQHIPKHGNYILASNHQSYLDVILISLPLGTLPYYFVLDTIWDKIPGMLRNHLNCIPVSRDPKRKTGMAFRQGLRVLRKGYSVCIFPEGQRTFNGRQQSFKHKGYLALHKMSGAPLLSVRIYGAYDVWPRWRRFPRLGGRIKVRYFPLKQI